MSTEYVERQAGESEEDRGRVLEALAGGDYWAFLITAIESDGTLSLKVEMDDRMDVDDLRSILRKTLDALPA